MRVKTLSEKTTERRIRYARGLLAVGLVSEALEQLNTIAAEEGDRLEVLQTKLDVHIAAKEWTPAEEAGRELVTRYPDAEAGWIGLAYALRETGQMSKARDVLLEAETEHGHSSPLIHYNLACYYSLAGDHAVARGFLAQACRMAANLEQRAFEDPDLKPLWV